MKEGIFWSKITSKSDQKWLLGDLTLRTKYHEKIKFLYEINSLQKMI